MTIPEKLKNDAIVEALFEIRFSTSTIPEVLFGRLSEYGHWGEFKQTLLPVSQLPLALRQADPNLRHQPVFALVDEVQSRAIRIGANVIVYARGIPYVGWHVFKPELENVVDGIFKKTSDMRIERLGIRYLNAFRRDLHGIESIADLNFRLEIAGQPIAGNANVNLTFDLESDTASTVRIATPDFVLGEIPPGTSVYVDVDVFTNEKGFSTTDQGFVKEWIERAHTKEKVQFFRLLTESKIASLVEK